jgi:hypothetical protein
MKTVNRILFAIGIFASNPSEAKFLENPMNAPHLEPIEVKQDTLDAQDTLGNQEAPRGITIQRISFDPFGKNFRDTTYAHFQFSFLPYVGTNGTYSGDVVNDYSINFLGGYSGGTEKLELAGLFNINRGEMNGVQLAGWFNQVGGKVDGVQLAGLFNSNLDSVEAVQVAGLVNFTTGPVDGVQLAGLTNFSPKSVKGVQLAGLLNFAAGEVEGTQIAGGLNFTPKNLKGSQVGLVNFANKVDGFQLGLLNYSDSISGVPVGFLTFVRSGYHVAEISVNEIMPFNLAFRTGKREFYNIFFAGIRPEWDDQVTWSFGYGLGTSPRLGKKTYLNIEVSSEQLSKGGVEALNLINRFYLGGEFQASKRLAIFAGPTLSYRVYDTSFNGHPDLFTYANPTIHSDRYHPEDLGSQVWWGFRAGMRFF